MERPPRHVRLGLHHRDGLLQGARADSRPQRSCLDFKQWGTLAIISGGKGGGITITNERACILVANIHFLVVSLCAAFCPLPFQDTLLLEPGEPDEEPAGLVPAFDTGLTPAAELWNGLAMLGLHRLLGVLDDHQIPFLNAVDNALRRVVIGARRAALRQRSRTWPRRSEAAPVA